MLPVSGQESLRKAGMTGMPRKVLGLYHLAPRRVGGAERICRARAEALAARGIASVLAFSRQPAPVVRRFFEGSGIELEVLERPERANLRAQRRFFGLVRKHRPEAVHLHFIDLFSPYPLLARLAGARQVVFHDHISRPEAWTPVRAGLFKRAAFRLAVPAARVACVSDFNRRCWLESGLIPAARLCRLYNGVDVDACQSTNPAGSQAFRARFGISASAFLVVQVCSMVSAKGVETVLEAASLLIGQDPDIHFLLAGDGSELVRYREMARQAGIAHRVTFTGLIDDPVGEGLFAAADVVCQASNWNEAFGLTIAEAMASARPVVGTRVGGIPELVEDGVTGLLVTPRDAPGLAGALAELRQAPERRIAMGQAGLARCAKRFSLQANVEGSLALLDLPA